jgi:3-deoxy-7-phosphoheptulonate synthase
MPVGFKNGTDGDTQVAIDAVMSARRQHWFPGVTKQGVSAILQTTGNEQCHVILRGGTRTGPNYHADQIEAVCATLERLGAAPRLMVDCSHGNSQRDHNRQMEVAADLARQIAGGSRRIFGVMLESHLVAGRQDHHAGVPLVYGQSITDACVGLDQTESMLDALATAVRQRRGTTSKTEPASRP